MNPFTGFSSDEVRALLTPHISMSIIGEQKTQQLVNNCMRRVHMADPAWNVGSNNLGQTADTLWRVIADEWIDTTTKKYTFLDAVTTQIRDYIPMEGPNVRPVVNVEMMLGAGSAIVNATDWEQTELTNKYIPVTLDRISRPFGLSTYDLMHGERIGTKIGTAIEAVVAGVFARFCAAVAAVMPTATATTAPVAPTATTAGTAGLLVTTRDQWTPEYVASTISALFGDYGAVEHLLLSPDALAPLVPSNALSLNYATGGTYGIDRISSTAGIKDAISGGNCSGLAMRRDAVLMAGGRPDLSGLESVVSVRDIGTVAGIPLSLKSWVKPGVEQIFFSVETMAGFAIGNTNALYGIQINPSA